MGRGGSHKAFLHQLGSQDQAGSILTFVHSLNLSLHCKEPGGCTSFPLSLAGGGKNETRPLANEGDKVLGLMWKVQSPS